MANRYKGVIIGGIQGILLYILLRLVQLGYIPSTKTILWYPLATVITFLPISLQLLTGTARYIIKSLLVIVTILLITSLYLSWLYDGFEVPSAFFYLNQISLALIVSLPFLQSYGEAGKISYTSLYNYSWSNVILLIEASIFTLFFWAVLWLCTGLFSLIKIDIFARCFSQSWFICIVTPLVFNGSIAFLQAKANIVKVVHHHILSVFTWLLPLVSLMIISFIIALIFTGLAPLWATKSASIILCLTQLAMIFLVNAAYQDGNSQARFNKWIMFLINIAILSLPIYSCIAIYSFSLRINQYGLSVERVWGILVIGLIALYSCGYALATLQRRLAGIAKLDNVNILAAIILVAALILFNSPLLDPRQIVIETQSSRLLKGIISPEQFDTRNIITLGKLGRSKIEYLNNHGYSFQLRDNTLPNWPYSTNKADDDKKLQQDLTGKIKLLPAGTLDNSLISYLSEKESELTVNCLSAACIALQITLSHDNTREEYVIFSPYQAILVSKDQNNIWQRVASITAPESKFNLNEIAGAIIHNKVKKISPLFDDLEINGKRYTLHLR